MKKSKPIAIVDKFIKQHGDIGQFLFEFTYTSFRDQHSRVQVHILDACWSYLVKKRAGFVSELSGKTDALNSHHLVNRSAGGHRLRWELENGICITWHEHNYYAHSANFEKQKEFRDKVMELRGADIYDRLGELKRGPVKDKAGLFWYFKEENNLLQGE